MDTTEKAVIVQNLKKDFILPQHKNTSFKHVLVNLAHGNKKTIQHVLSGISFEVNKGDFFGIVGRNGSGKSTLLKLLAGVYSPTSGSAYLNGSLTPFIELGVGFNPELSGRDNVYLNGALLGFNRKQMDAMYDEIVEFAELRPFMDQKLKNYSSGMQVRLAFSIAIKAKNEILIFDEVLAVGDEAFQRKCLDVFEKYKADGQTVILVTHDMATVRRYCNRALLLNKGEIVEIGDPRKVADKYSELNQQSIDEEMERANSELSEAKYLKAEILDENRKPRQSFEGSEKMAVALSWKGLTPELIESIGITIVKQTGEHVTGINSRVAPLSKNWREKGAITLEFQLDVSPGTYHLIIEVFKEEGKIIDAIIEGPRFSVKSTDKIQWSGLARIPYKWHEDEK